MRRYPAASAVNGPVSAWLYTRAMMITRILKICAAVAAAVAGTSFALAQGYPSSPPSYSTAPAPYPPGGYPAVYRRAPSAMVEMLAFDSMYEYDSSRTEYTTPLPAP